MGAGGENMNDTIRNGVPTCLAAHDLSGVGRCALTVVLPVLAALKVQTHVLPTGLFSNHLALAQPVIYDFTAEMQAWLQAWDVNGVRPDSIYSGFLTGPEQAEIIKGIAARYPTARHVLVDPAMADHGALYSSVPAEMIDAMRGLLRQADWTTPNYTEACFLTGTQYGEAAVPHERARQLAEQLALLGPERIVITSVPGEDGTLYNYLFEQENEHAEVFPFIPVGLGTVGTGDLFAAALWGQVLHGTAAVTAVRRAGQFVRRAVELLAQSGADPRFGVPFEAILTEWAGEVAI